MFSSTLRMMSALCLGLAVLLLAGCGGSSDRGGFTNPEDVLTVTVRTVDGSSEVDWNPGLEPLDPRKGYTKSIIVEVFDHELKYFPSDITVDIVPAGANGNLFIPIPPGGTIEDAGPFARAVIEGTSGIAELFFVANNNPGQVTFTASVEDPASGQLISGTLRLNVVGTTLPVTSLTFTGPFVNAVIEGVSSFNLASGEAILDGSYKRVVSVIANDENGNPPRIGTPVDFYLIDGPLVGYPATGAGSFAISGPDGDPEEGGIVFRVPPGTGGFQGPIINGPAVRPLNDRLVLDGRQSQNPGGAPQPNNRIFTGLWRIESVLTNDALTIEQDPTVANPRRFPPFPLNPANPDTGPSVPYIIGSALSSTILRTATTDDFGVASTLLTYPIYRIGQTAILVACTRVQDIDGDGNTDGPFDERVCGLLNTCNADGSNCRSVFLPATDGSDIVLTVDPTVLSANSTSQVTLCLRDRNSVPLPGTTIFYNFEGNLGSATVTVNGSPASSGSLLTGGDGCTVATVASSGQAPGSESIFITFDADDSNPDEAVTVEIKGPGAGNLSFALDCGGRICVDTSGPNPPPLSCTIDLLLTDDRGGPISDIVITHESSVPLLDIRYNPAFGSFGITSTNGTNVVSTVSSVVNDAPTVTFSAGTATAAVALGLPNCDDVLDLPLARLVGGEQTVVPGGSATYTVALSEPARVATPVSLQITGDTGQFESLPSSVTIPSGQSTATLTVTAQDGAPDGAALTITLIDGPLYDPGDPISGTVTVASPVATLTGDGAQVGPGETATLEVVLDAPVAVETTVDLQATGATGQFTVPASVTFEPGQSRRPVEVQAAANAPDLAALTVTLVAGTGYVVGDPASATVTVSNPPEASISTAAASVAPGGSVQFTVTLSAPAARETTVQLSVSGPGTPQSGSVMIGINFTTGTFTVTANADAADGATITVTVLAGEGYTVGTPSSASVQVVAPPPPTASISAQVGTVAPGGPVNFIVQLSAPATANTAVQFTVSGPGSPAAGSVTINAGSSVGSFAVTASNTAADGDIITATLAPGTGYTVGAPSSASVTVVAP